MTTIRGCWMVAVVAVLVAGCVSTPEKRIKKEPQVFAAFPPEIQQKVKRGEVEVGFSRDMVRLALGAPHRVSTRTTESGQFEVWTYMASRHVSRYEPSAGGYWYRDRSGRLRRSSDSVWIDQGFTEEYPVLRIELGANQVKAIERIRR